MSFESSMLSNSGIYEYGIIKVAGSRWYPVESIEKSYLISTEEIESIRLIEFHWFESNSAELTERAIRRWIDTHCGEFSRIDDFSYVFKKFTIEVTALKELTNREECAILPT